jgi:hypothetical protein
MTTHQDSKFDRADRPDTRRPPLYELVRLSKEGANDSVETLTLRVRKPQRNVNGSILLLSSNGDVWDCTECYQNSEMRYTEANWVEKYENMYGFCHERHKKSALARNVDKSNFVFKRGDRPVAANHTRLCDDAPIPDGALTHFLCKFNGASASAEIVIEETFEANEGSIGRVEYTSLYLKFKNVFEGSACKRVRV